MQTAPQYFKLKYQLQAFSSNIIAKKLLNDAKGHYLARFNL